MPLVEEGEYKGSPVLILKTTEEDRFPFQFGLRKAKMVLDHIDDIKNFVKKHEGDKTP
jgi:hypothetical protein